MRPRLRILLFLSVTFKMQKKYFFFTRFYACFFLKELLHYSLKIKNQKKVPKRMRIREAPKNTDPADVDPDKDPEH